MSPTTRDTAELLALKTRIAALSPADQLRLCAGLLDHGKYDIAETLIGNIVDELRALRLLRNRAELTR
jgi:hypothetical protein